ncbi:MAG: hypothetical protein HY719_09495 [Planctomycetes bacterium]|nr:hypothetical protein [Planctomycetota bacterium]
MAGISPSCLGCVERDAIIAELRKRVAAHAVLPVAVTIPGGLARRDGCQG